MNISIVDEAIELNNMFKGLALQDCKDEHVAKLAKQLFRLCKKLYDAREKTAFLLLIGRLVLVCNYINEETYIIPDENAYGFHEFTMNLHELWFQATEIYQQWICN